MFQWKWEYHIQTFSHWSKIVESRPRFAKSKNSLHLQRFDFTWVNQYIQIISFRSPIYDFFLLPATVGSAINDAGIRNSDWIVIKHLNSGNFWHWCIVFIPFDYWYRIPFDGASHFDIFPLLVGSLVFVDFHLKKNKLIVFIFT